MPSWSSQINAAFDTVPGHELQRNSGVRKLEPCILLYCSACDFESVWYSGQSARLAAKKWNAAHKPKV